MGSRDRERQSSNLAEQGDGQCRAMLAPWKLALPVVMIFASIIGASTAWAASVYDDTGMLDWYGCKWWGLMGVEDPPVDPYTNAATYEWYYDGCADRFIAATYPWTGTQYVGYSSGWVGFPGAYVEQDDYDATRAYGYHEIQNPLGVISYTAETFASQ